MTFVRAHREKHRVDRIGWLRAAVLGANDGLVSTASLVVGVGSSGAGPDAVLLAGFAGLTAGAMSMAAGEYVSVSSQADTERADIALERRELAANPAGELRELTEIYMQRGLSHDLSRQVAEELSRKDPLAAHLRDELGITDDRRARPLQAAAVSAVTFAVGAAPPILVAVVLPGAGVVLAVALSTLAALCVLGGLGAWIGGASIFKGAARVCFWGALAMAATAAVGHVFGVALG